MASSFKIKLKLPPNPSGQPSSSNQNSPQRSSVPAEGSSVVDGGSSAVSEDGGGEEMDELEDSPPPQNSASASPSSSRMKNGAAKGTSTSSNSASGIKKARPSIPMGLPKPVDQMTIEEIEALPAAKRRKSLKARGAAGPGRGWRKGLKMDQKPVYVQPGSTAPPTKVAASTPSSFANSKVKSSLARDAISKTSTPLRSESPFSSGSPMGNEDLDSRKEDEKKAPVVTSSSAPFRIYYRSTQPVHPIAKIPIGFASVAPLDKSGSKRPVRPWEKEIREIVTLTGKTWSALTWLTKQQSQSEVDKENAVNTETNIPSLSSAMPVRPSYMTINNDDTAPSTPGEAYNIPRSAAADSALASARNPGSSPEIDWRGSSAAFTAANKR